MLKYVTHWDKEIKTMEVVRETASCVFYLDSRGKERRQNKMSDWESVFDTWEAARDHLLNKAERKLESARYQLQQYQGLVGNIKGMVKP